MARTLTTEHQANARLAPAAGKPKGLPELTTPLTAGIVAAAARGQGTVLVLDRLWLNRTAMVAQLAPAYRVRTAGSANAARAILDAWQTDILLLDHTQQGMTALVHDLSGRAQPVPFIVCSLGGQQAKLCRLLGASGFIDKETPGDLRRAVAKVLAGGTAFPGELLTSAGRTFRDALRTLAPQARQVFDLLVRGMRPEDIAAKLGVGVSTIKTYHIGNLGKKFGFAEWHDLCLLALQVGYISVADLIVADPAGAATKGAAGRPDL